MDPHAKKVATVNFIDSSVMDQAGASKSSLGTGGMRSKLRAARMATAAGESAIIANGADPTTLDAIFACEPAGTLFLPHGSSLPAWKRWLGFTAQPRGKIVINDGAKKALCEQGKSLLSVGIVAIHGAFHKGDVVSLCDAAGAEFARGLTNYSAADADRILGLRTEKIAEVLGSIPYEEVVHRDNLLVTA
jgi:glutamate 5-kinase